MPTTRRLAAILAADVAGYSRLIGADEEGTLLRLRSIRAEVIDPKIDEHHGRLVKTTGDGLLVEFGSVVDALRCATEVQQMLALRNSEVDEDRSVSITGRDRRSVFSRASKRYSRTRSQRSASKPINGHLDR